MNAVAIGVAIMVVGTTALLVLKAAGGWLSKAIARDIHDGIGEVVRAQLESLTVSVSALDARDAKGHTDLMARLNEVDVQNTRDHGLVAARLAGVELRLARVERLVSAPATIEINNEGGKAS